MKMFENIETERRAEAPLSLLLEAVIYARGNEGRILPCPDLAEPRHVFELCRFAARVQSEEKL